MRQMKNPLNEVFSEGNGDGLCAVRGIYLVENGAHVVVDAVEANPKQGCDVLVRESACHCLENLLLTWRQLRNRRVCGKPALDFS